MPDEPREALRLTGWKEIAQHLGVEVRTAQRWERERGLPVERSEGDRGRVTADGATLDRWRQANISKPKVWTNVRILQVYCLTVTSVALVGWALAAYGYFRMHIAGPP